MRSLHAALIIASVVAFSPAASGAADYDACDETFYDSTEEPCGGGHQHTAGKRVESSLELSRHRHRHLEVQIHELEKTVAKLSDAVEQLKKAAAQ
jgi:hypothetical protein